MQKSIGGAGKAAAALGRRRKGRPSTAIDALPLAAAISLGTLVGLIFAGCSTRRFLEEVEGASGTHAAITDPDDRRSSEIAYQPVLRQASEILLVLNKNVLSAPQRNGAGDVDDTVIAEFIKTLSATVHPRIDTVAAAGAPAFGLDLSLHAGPASIPLPSAQWGDQEAQRASASQIVRALLAQSVQDQNRPVVLALRSAAFAHLAERDLFNLCLDLMQKTPWLSYAEPSFGRLYPNEEATSAQWDEPRRSIKWDEAVSLIRAKHGRNTPAGDDIHIAIVSTGLVSPSRFTEISALKAIDRETSRTFLPSVPLPAGSNTEGDAAASDVRVAGEAEDPVNLNGAQITPGLGTRLVTLLTGMEPHDLHDENPDESPAAMNATATSPLTGLVPGAHVTIARASRGLTYTLREVDPLLGALRHVQKMSATNRHVHVLLIALSGPAHPDLKKLIREILNAGTIIIADQGNAGTDKTYLPWPAAYEGVLSARPERTDCSADLKTRSGPVQARASRTVGSPAHGIWHLAPRLWLDKSGPWATLIPGSQPAFASVYLAAAASLWIQFHGYNQLLRHFAGNAGSIPTAFGNLVTESATPACSTPDEASSGPLLLNTTALLQAPLPLRIDTERRAPSFLRPP